METTRPNQDIFDQPRQGLPGMLNTLTILTFIGCGLSYLSAIYSFFQSNNYEKEKAELLELQDKAEGNEMSARILEGSLELLEKTHEYRYVLLLAGVLFTTLCLIGAMQMRKLKKSGFPIYAVGEIAPIILTAAVLGFSLMGSITTIITGCIALLFVILYATQRKHLVY